MIIVAAADTGQLASQTIGSRLSSSTNPPPQGRLIRGRDGDTIVLEKDERVRVIHRRSAVVRATYNAAERWLLLVLDFAAEPGAAPDGRADWTYTYRELTGDWPLGARWEGEAIVEDYSVAGQGGQRGFGLRTSQVMVQLMSGPADDGLFHDPAVVAVLTYRGAGRGGAGGASFDEAEQRAAAELRANLARNAQSGSMSTMTSYGPGTGSLTSTLTAGVGLVGPGTDGPARVGSRIASPRKTYDVPPVLPELARQAGVRGVVVVEVTIGADGVVTDARVLRSIPLLDAAALTAVRQWRFEPTLLNGQPVPIVATVPVTFQ
jgi:TonB family protein